MTEEERLEKNKRIGESQRETRLKRQTQVCSVYNVKIQYSHLNLKQKEQLQMLFVEAKWLWNDILNFTTNNKISDYDTKTKTVNVKTKDGSFKERDLLYIGSSLKQAVKRELIYCTKALNVLKQHGKHIGWINFRSDCKSIDLSQYGNTHRILDKTHISIQGIKGRLKVRGLEQFINEPNIDIANAKLLNKPDGYYIAITIFRNKSDIKEQTFIGKEIGIDMGIGTHIALSNGEKFNSTIEETEHLKYLQKQLFRRQKGSNNRRKTIKLIDKEYQKLTNKKNDIANKLVHHILSYETVYMQDEMISNWHKGLFGKQVQHSILGRFKSKLINHPRVEVLDKSVPTTQYCPICGSLTKHSLDKRTYHCDNCGYKDDRDVNAAKNMIRLVKIIKQRTNNIADDKRIKNNSVGVGHIDFKPLEIETSCIISNNNVKSLSLN